MINRYVRYGGLTPKGWQSLRDLRDYEATNGDRGSCYLHPRTAAKLAELKYVKTRKMVQIGKSKAIECRTTDKGRLFLNVTGRYSVPSRQ
jgi:hypothetical protein